MVLGVAMLGSAACAELGALEDVLGGVLGAGTQGGELVAEVQRVETGTQQIQVRTQDGQMGAVGYDNRTQVVYQQQQYPVTALEAGDIVAMRLQEDNLGNLYTDYIQVRQSVQERTGTGAAGQLQRIEGTVGQIDTQRGLFELHGQQGESTVVSLPYNPRSEDVERFRRLRSGDRVRVEGRFVSQTRFELERFY